MWKTLVVFKAHETDHARRVSFRRYKPLKLPLSCEVVEAPDF